MAKKKKEGPRSGQADGLVDVIAGTDPTQRIGADIDASTTEGIDADMAGNKPGNLDQRGMISQGDMEPSGDNEELRRQRRDNINPSQPITPEKPV